MPLPRDTIGWRIAMTVGAAIVGVLVVSALFNRYAGVWVRPVAEESVLLSRANDLVRMIEIVPPEFREPLAKAAQIPEVNAEWYAANTSLARSFATSTMNENDVELSSWFDNGGQRRRTLLFESDRPVPGQKYGVESQPHAYLLALELRDHSWVAFNATRRVWGLSEPAQVAFALIFVAVSILAAALLATHYLARPIRQFADDLRAFGGDPRTSPLLEAGPHELRAAIAAFNTLQAQLRRFVEDRTAMLAAMSHDLRTPLTKIRLRGEFIEDEDQRTRLFRDVDDLQAMADSALSFFRDDFTAEEPTAFDFAGLLHAMADDYADHGEHVSYAGPERLVFTGRPFSLRRACMNLVDNALKYGDCAELELHGDESQIRITICDRGPGIPAGTFEQVFAPFFRLEKSRNRTTGGMGLGLTSARAIVRAHGGDIKLANRPSGGLQVGITLPIGLPTYGP
ncbi:HAMP domain protein [Burkholderia gladioli]|nr:HAMP domain protein [Burkholderia gladioli]